ncbi:histidine kinase [Paracidovorax avenae]
MTSSSVPDSIPPSRAAAWLGRLHPRRNLAAAIGWSMLALVALASLVAGQLAAADAERAERAATQRLMAQFATQVRSGLDMGLRLRVAVLQVTASQIAVSGDQGAQPLRLHLEALRAQFPEFAWLGVTDAGGSIRAAAGVPQGAGPPTSPQAQADALAEPFLGGASGRDGSRGRALDAALPIAHGQVLVAQLSRDWIGRFGHDLLAGLGAQRPPELLLIGPDGSVLTGPAGWIGRDVAGMDLTEGGRFVVGRHGPALPEGRAGWSVAVRQPADIALEGVERLRNTVLLTVLLAGLLAALCAPLLTGWLTRRLNALAQQAQEIREGRRGDIVAPPGRDEVGRIGATLAALVAQLQAEKAALASLNAVLDQRVAERTARIQRMSEEARAAAVTRERLRLARDLHDTLAHSLMALLQQIRLVRKLGDRMGPEDLAAELGRAEEVAASGLAEARAAITQMRHGSVREKGLSAALRDLLARFGERTGLATEFTATGAAADLADERAETLYRIAEEALRNIERHAQARTAAVDLADEAGQAVLRVRDDGRGFDPQAPCAGHYGLVGIREQAALVGAALSIGSRPGAGCELRVAFAP